MSLSLRLPHQEGSNGVAPWQHLSYCAFDTAQRIRPSPGFVLATTHGCLQALIRSGSRIVRLSYLREN